MQVCACVQKCPRGGHRPSESVRTCARAAGKLQQDTLPLPKRGVQETLCVSKNRVSGAITVCGGVIVYLITFPCFCSLFIATVLSSRQPLLPLSVPCPSLRPHSLHRLVLSLSLRLLSIPSWTTFSPISPLQTRTAQMSFRDER